MVKLKLFQHIFSTSRCPKSGLVTLILISLGLFFELVFPESTSEGSRPHMQCCPGGEGEEEEEGHLETKPIHHASGQSAEHQLPQHLQSCQETVVGRLNAFLGPLSAIHHGSEGERGDETAQEVLNTHAQDGHAFHEW